MMRTWIVLLSMGGLALMGCKGEVKSDAMRLSWKPPRGVSLTEEKPEVLRFSGGVEIRQVNGEPPALDEGKLDALLLTVLNASNLGPLPVRISARLGTVPAGAVARYVLAGNGQRELLYYVPLKGRFLVVVMAAPEKEFGTRENQLDLSLSTLKVE